MSRVEMSSSGRKTCKCAVAFAAFEVTGSRGGGRHDCGKGKCANEAVRSEERLGWSVTTRTHILAHPQLFYLQTPSSKLQPKMPATTRSKTKPNTGNTPPSKQQPAPPKPPKRNTKGGLAQALKNPVSARENGVGLLEMLQGEQEQELDDALGGEGHNHSGSRSSARGHGRSRGRGRGCGRGGRGRGRNGAQSNQEMTLVTETLEAADTSNADRPNQNVSHLVIQ